MAKILIIDDDAETIKLLESIMQLNGHEIKSVVDSKKAISVAEAFNPDVILLDIMMPDVNGITICKLIKSGSKTNRTKVVMISALNDEDAKRDSINAGADQFVSKPIIPRVFSQQIKDLLVQ